MSTAKLSNNFEALIHGNNHDAVEIFDERDEIWPKTTRDRVKSPNFYRNELDTEQEINPRSLTKSLEPHGLSPVKKQPFREMLPAMKDTSTYMSNKLANQSIQNKPVVKEQSVQAQIVSNETLEKLQKFEADFRKF